MNSVIGFVILLIMIKTCSSAVEALIILIIPNRRIPGIRDCQPPSRPESDFLDFRQFTKLKTKHLQNGGDQVGFSLAIFGARAPRRTRSGPNRVAADMGERQNLIFWQF